MKRYFFSKEKLLEDMKNKGWDQEQLDKLSKELWIELNDGKEVWFEEDKEIGYTGSAFIHKNWVIEFDIIK